MTGGGALVDLSSCERGLSRDALFFADRLHSSIGKSGPNRILTIGDSAMFAVYVLGTWRLHATFSTRDAAESLVARLVSRGVRAKLFRTAETQRGAA